MREIKLLFLCAILGSGCTGTENPKMNDMHRIQGDWLLVAGQRHGEVFTDKVVGHVTLTFNGNVLKTAKPSGVSEANFTLHPEMDPKGIDLDMDGSTGLGIYNLEGDTLTIVHGEVEEPRPKDFDAGATSDLNVLVLKKVEK